ncbi:transposase [Porphyrobacter sp. YT40]|nr:transposase [Porphyrobacter sp. YT40]
MLHFANSTEGVNAAFLGRHLGITYPAAFRMAYKIRLHLAALEERAEPIAVGQDIHARLVTVNRARSGSQSPNTLNVLFVASDTRLDCAVLPAPRRHSVRAAIESLMPNHGQVLTTCHRTSQVLSAYKTRQPLATFEPTFFIDHPADRDLISGFLSYFLKPFNNHHKHASREHFWLYLKDFQFRYNRRDHSGQTYWDMVRSFPQLDLQSLQRRR